MLFPKLAVLLSLVMATYGLKHKHTFMQKLSVDEFEFVQYISKHGKSYVDKDEFDKRLFNFKNSKQLIKELSAKKG